MFDSIDTETFLGITAPATEQELADIESVIHAGDHLSADDFNIELKKHFPFMFSDTGYNHLYDVYDGWLTAFSVPFLIHVKRALAIDGAEAKILDMKEKFGTLRVYWGYTHEYTELTTTMYELLSGYYCCHCGKYGAKLTQSRWVTALCSGCWNPDHDGNFGSSIPLEPLKITSYNEGKTVNTEYQSEPWVKAIDELSAVSKRFTRTWLAINSSQWVTM